MNKKNLVKNIDTDIATLFGEKIKQKIDKALEYTYRYGDYSNEKFELIKQLASLVSELLDKDGIKEKLIKLANTSKVNGDNNEIKIETFDLIRNILIHFPIFESWDEIYISKKLLKWNTSKNGQIINYFNKNCNKSFQYRIFLNENDKWIERHTIEVKIPELKDDNIIYLKDILSLDNAIWTFGIIDYYLKDLGLNIQPYIFIASL